MNASLTIPERVVNNALPARLTGRWLRLARVVWWVLAGYPTLLFWLDLAPAFEKWRATCELGLCTPQDWLVLTPPQALALQAMELSLDLYAAYLIVLNVMVALAYLGCGLLIFYHRSDEWIAWIASLTLVVLGVYLIPGTKGSALVAYPSLWPLFNLTIIWGNWCFAAFLFLTPNGRFTPSWSRWFCLLWGGWVSYLMLFVDPVAQTSPDSWINRASLLIFLTCVGVGIYGYVYRYWRVATPLIRQQLKWLAFGLLGYIFNILLGLITPLSSSSNSPTVIIVGATLMGLAWILFPIAVAFAILRYRLFDIDLILNRALTYSGLTAIVVLFYALIVGGANALLHLPNDAGGLSAFLAAGLIAALFHPLRVRLQRLVNRLLYGQRDEPYAVLTHFGRQLAATPALATLQATMVATIKETLKLPHVVVEIIGQGMRDGDQRTDSSSSPTIPNPCPLIAFPLIYQNEMVGQLVVAPREGEATLSPTDQHLLAELARQAGVAVHAARVTSELQHARERLVAAREEERRRLRRDLHDGLGPALAAIAAQAEGARDLIPTQPHVSTQLLSDIVTQAQNATTDIRRLVYALRPPALDELGLVGALQAQAYKLNQSNGLQVTVQAGELPPLPAAVEVAAYRIAQEALTNVVRHAHATRCTITLNMKTGAGQHLALEVADNGCGLPANPSRGVGLSSMRERAQELGGEFVTTSHTGGGTTVFARLPLHV